MTRIYTMLFALLIFSGIFELTAEGPVMPELTANATESKYYRLTEYSDALKEPSDVYLEQKDRFLQRAISFLGITTPIQPLNYYLYPTCEDKGLAVQNTNLSHADPAGSSVHTVICGNIRGDDGYTDVLVLLRNYVGLPAVAALETGLAVYLSQNWRGDGFAYWAARLYLAESLPPLSEVLDNDLFGKESNLVMQPAAAAFVAFIVHKWGRETLLTDYLTWKPTADELVYLDRQWREYLAEISAATKDKIVRSANGYDDLDMFQKGFCHAHEGYRIYNGYLSRQSDQALEKLAALGGNAVSITPFTYMRDPKKASWLPLTDRPGSENDESVIHSAMTARSLNMVAMLKPHIWLRRSWPGEVEMSSPEAWDLFFDYYYRWIRHYAMLAEMYQIDIFCIGVELGKTTVGHEERWLEMLRKIRNLYGGKITYAANWGDEFEQVGFWEYFDFIGINCYYPLSKAESPSDTELDAGMKLILAKIESVHQKYKRPVLFTEIGFTSTPKPWKQPHESAWKQPTYMADQARCYQIVLQNLYEQEWVSGIYWWKWPSYLEYGGSTDNDFTPNMKDAEKVIDYWYKKEWPR